MSATNLNFSSDTYELQFSTGSFNSLRLRPLMLRIIIIITTSSSVVVSLHIIYNLTYSFLHSLNFKNEKIKA